jgi:L-lactate dehydrogenase complex protein LldG
MKESTSKEKVLKKVRNALISKLDNPFANIDFNSPVFPPQIEEPEVEFAQNFIENSGTFIYCENEKDVIDQLTELIKKENWKNIFCYDKGIASLLNTANIEYSDDDEKFNELEVGITPCDFLISRFGSVMVSSGMGSGRKLPFYSENHVVIARASQVVKELKDALIGMKKKYSDNFPSQITNIMGPSRTADIEKTLVMGAHGPRNMILFMIDDK